MMRWFDHPNRGLTQSLTDRIVMKRAFALNLSLFSMHGVSVQVGDRIWR
jgi:hypothetical protein